MEKKLYLQYIDGDGNTHPLVVSGSQIEIVEFKYESTRMSGSPTISFTLLHEQCLENILKDSVFAEFNGERYYVSQTPSCSFDNTDARYIHNVILTSERAILDSVYFYDVVSEDYEGDKPVSNSSKVTFHGTVHEFADRLNYSLQYAKLQTKKADGTYSGYRVVVDEGVESKDTLVAFNDQFMSSVLQEIYNTYEVPYYFVGKTIHIGTASEIINTEFQYGANDALISIRKENRNNKVINRCTGVGSSENIPYYYPNLTPLGDIETVVTGSITEAKISKTDKFSNQSLLNSKLTYTKIEGSPLNDTTFGYSYVSVEDNKTKEAVLLVPSYEIPAARFEKSTDSFWVEIDATNYESGETKVFVQFQLSQPEVYEGDAGTREEFKDKISPRTHVYLSTNNGVASLYQQTYDNTWKNQDYRLDVPLTVKSGNIYRLVVWPTIDVSGWMTSSQRESIKNWKAKIKVNAGITLSENDSYWPNYAWCNDNGDVISLTNAGISITGTPAEGDTIKFNLLRKVAPQTNLMPPIYRLSEGKERFYNAVNTDGYEFPNPYVIGKPKEHIAEFPEVKPTITGMSNRYGQPIDHFLEFAYDTYDKDSGEYGSVEENETEEKDGNFEFKHPYFFAKLPKLDFNLFDHAIENGEMTISMTSGGCGACNFVIGVSELSDGKQVNTVQVDNNGKLLRDEKGNVICGREPYQSPVAPQDRQNDTINNEVWIALRKEEETYGTLMPTIAPNINAQGETIGVTSIIPSTEDTFVITNIQLPQSYIEAAEEKLKTEILDYMLENNSEKFNFSLKFSRIYLQEHDEILKQLNENARIKIKYNGTVYEQYINSFSYTMGGEALPEISVELVEDLVTPENPIQRAVGEVGSMVASMITGMDTVTQNSPYFISKNSDDVSYGNTAFRNGVEFGIYTDGINGSGGAVKIDSNGNSIAEFDFLNIRKKALFKEITVQEIKNVGGELILTPAAMVCSRFTEQDNSFRCYFDTNNGDGTNIKNEFVVGDQARCQTFNLEGNRYYWRLVVAVGDDYIDLSKEDCEVNSDRPMAGDNIVSLGNRTDTTRQSAIVLSAYGTNSPSITQYSGIDSYSLEGKMVTKFSNGENVITGKMTILPNSTGAANLTDLEVGGANMIRNSGFTGDYVSKELTDEVVLEAADELFSPALDHWENTNAVVQDSAESQSGKEVVVTNGSISQTLEFPIIAGECYVLSFKAKGKTITYSIGGVTKTITAPELNEYEHMRHVEKFTAVNSDSNLTISGNYSLCEIQLERGTVASAWSNNFKDNTSDRTYYQAQKYLSDAIHNKSTVEGALTLTQIVGVGDYANGEMTKMTGGMSGRYSGDDNNVAFWAGGDFASAMDTVNKFASNPSYQPTSEELATMAKFVVTHGGRAILNDIILRGYVYAEGGEFNGVVRANSGIFSGLIKRTPTVINGDNYQQYVAAYDASDDNWHDLDLEKSGTFIVFKGFIPVVPHFSFPTMYYSTSLGKYTILPANNTFEDIIGLVGQKVFVINNCNQTLWICGPNLSCSFLETEQMAMYECVMELVTDEIDGTKWRIIWKQTSFDTPAIA